MHTYQRECNCQQCKLTIIIFIITDNGGCTDTSLAYQISAYWLVSCHIGKFFTDITDVR